MKTSLIIGLVLTTVALTAFAPTASAADCTTFSPDNAHPQDVLCVVRCTYGNGGTDCVARWFRCPPTC